MQQRADLLYASHTSYNGVVENSMNIPNPENPQGTSSLSPASRPLPSPSHSVFSHYFKSLSNTLNPVRRTTNYVSSNGTNYASPTSNFPNSTHPNSPKHPLPKPVGRSSRYPPQTPCSSFGGTSASIKLPSKENRSWKSIFVNLRTRIPQKDATSMGAELLTPDISDESSSSPELPVLIDPKFQAAPLWRLLTPFSLRFKRTSVEDMFAAFVQAQISKNLWWALWVLVFCVMTEYFITVFTTSYFSPLHQPAHFLYSLGALIIVIGGILISLLSWNQSFEPYLEACVAVFGAVFASLMVFTSDHFRVASILGFNPEVAWGRVGFSDAPLLLGLNAILWAIAIFLPVRSVCLWPVCLSAVISYQFATFVCGSPDGLRPSVLNILLLIVLSYLALIGRRALEAQLRLQFIEVHRTACKIQLLENQILQYQQPATTTLEWLFNSLRDASARVEYVYSCIEDEFPEMAAILEGSLKGVHVSLMHLSRIDSLLSVNLNAIIDRSGNNSSNFLNDSTKLFIRSNFSRPSNNEANFDTKKVSSKAAVTHESTLDKNNEGIKFSVLVGLSNFNDEWCAFDEIGTNWNFDTLSLEKKSKGRSLILVGMYLLEPYGKQYLRCEEEIFKFLNEIQMRYQKNPYHNSSHGADVCHSALFLLNALELFDQLDFCEQLATIVGTLCHDVAHPGKNSAFLVATGNEISIIYNDQSVLEQFHSSQTFQALKMNGCNFVKNLLPDQFKKFRRAVIDLILETDMSKHFESIAKFKLLRQNSGFSIRHRNEDRWHAIRMCVKAADISHSAKNWNLHLLWSLKCIEEFFIQGDEEKALSLSLSPLCDRNKAYEIPKSQIGFLQLVSLELFQELHKLEEFIILNDEGRTVGKNATSSNLQKTYNTGKSSSIGFPTSTPTPASQYLHGSTPPYIPNKLLTSSLNTIPTSSLRRLHPFYPNCTHASYPVTTPGDTTSQNQNPFVPSPQFSDFYTNPKRHETKVHPAPFSTSVTNASMMNSSDSALRSIGNSYFERRGVTFSGDNAISFDANTKYNVLSKDGEKDKDAIGEHPQRVDMNETEEPQVSFNDKALLHLETTSHKASETSANVDNVEGFHTLLNSLAKSSSHGSYKMEDFEGASSPSIDGVPINPRSSSYGNALDSVRTDGQIKKYCIEELLENKRLWESYALAFEDLTEPERSSEWVLQVLLQSISH